MFIKETFFKMLRAEFVFIVGFVMMIGCIMHSIAFKFYPEMYATPLKPDIFILPLTIMVAGIGVMMIRNSYKSENI